jgi:integrase
MGLRTKNTKAGLVYYVETRGHWERVGGDKREAQRLNERRKKEAKAGTFAPKVSGSVSIGRYLETWLDDRKNRSADQDRTHIETHVLHREWFAKLKMEDARPPHFQRLVAELKAGPPKLAPKYIANIFGSVRTAFRAALRQEVIARDVCLLDPGTLSKKSKEAVPYSLAEARALIAAATGDRLVWLALALYTGMRCGEVCGRRWRDWDPESLPLGAMTIATQYDDQPLKGDDESVDRPRRAPVHPDLAKLLEWWWAEGFELTYLRKPTRDDFIVERRDAQGENLTRTMTYKALERDRKAAGVAKVKGRAQHGTRHTFLTQARRASPQARELAEKITHNAKGEMVDQYTHWEWDPLCSVVSAFPSLLPVSETGSEIASRNPLFSCSDSRTRTGVASETVGKVAKEGQSDAEQDRDFARGSSARAAFPGAVSESEEEDFRAAVAESTVDGMRGVRLPVKTRPYIARDRGIRRAVTAARSAGKLGAR